MPTIDLRRSAALRALEGITDNGGSVVISHSSVSAFRVAEPSDWDVCISVNHNGGERFVFADSLFEALEALGEVKVDHAAFVEDGRITWQEPIP